ncbi:MAG TPA: ABC transporter substrate-binding protein [Stellaceae bacterium]|nr:ABC transporter substrate-binding protein [Stellaceae bacterium]
MLRWLAIPAVALAALGSVRAEPIRIVLVETASDIGAQQADQGFRLGLDYATKGTLSVGGRALEVTVDSGRANGALRNTHADLLVSLDDAPIPEILDTALASKRVLVLARADRPPAANRYVFRAAPNASQLALACVMALGFPELNLFAVAPDTAKGHDSVAALKDALERVPRGVFYAGSKFIRTDADIGAAVSSEYDGLHFLHGAKTLLMIGNGGHPPTTEIAATNPGKFGIRLALCGDIDPEVRSAEPAPALEGVTSYFYALRHNAANDWLIAKAQERTHEKPDAAMADGMAAAIAVVAALATAPSTDADALIAKLEGLSVETPKGRMTIRPEDHQALQSIYQFRIEPPSTAPELVREISP